MIDEDLSEEDMKDLAEYAFEDWLSRLKKEQRRYGIFKGVDLDETVLKNMFMKGKTTTDALNDLSTIT